MTEPTQAQIDAAVSAMKKIDSLYVFGEPYLLGVAKAALTAAAEVGEQSVGLDIMNKTIERCAQVAESFHAYDRPAAEIAAAIRAKKDSHD